MRIGIIVYLVQFILWIFAVILSFLKFIFLKIYSKIRQLIFKKSFENELADSDKQTHDRLQTGKIEVPKFRSDPLFQEIYTEGLAKIENANYSGALLCFNKILNKEVDTGGRTLIESEQMYIQTLTQKALCHAYRKETDKAMEILEGERLPELLSSLNEGEFHAYHHLTLSRINDALGKENEKKEMLVKALNIALTKVRRGPLANLCLHQLFSYLLEKKEWAEIQAFADLAMRNYIVIKDRYLLFQAGKYYCLALRELGKEDDCRETAQVCIKKLSEFKMNKQFIQEFDEYLK